MCTSQMNGQGGMIAQAELPGCLAHGCCAVGAGSPGMTVRCQPGQGTFSTRLSAHCICDAKLLPLALPRHTQSKVSQSGIWSQELEVTDGSEARARSTRWPSLAD